MFEFISWIVGSLALAWGWFALFGIFKPKMERYKKEKKLLYYFLMTLGTLGFAYDVLMNMTVFTIMYLDPPQEWTVTARVQRMLEDRMWAGTWRRKLAEGMKLLVFDPIDKNHLD